MAPLEPLKEKKRAPVRRTKNVKRGVRGVDTWMGCMPWMDKSMHGLAVKTMLCSSLTPSSQARQRGRRILEATWISEGGSSQSKGGKGLHFCLQIWVMPGDATFATSWLI